MPTQKLNHTFRLPSGWRVAGRLCTPATPFLTSFASRAPLGSPSPKGPFTPKKSWRIRLVPSVPSQMLCITFRFWMVSSTASFASDRSSLRTHSRNRSDATCHGTWTGCSEIRSAKWFSFRLQAAFISDQRLRKVQGCQEVCDSVPEMPRQV